MKEALVICQADPNTDPRPNRMIRSLKNDYKVTALSKAMVEFDEVNSYILPAGQKGTPAKRLLTAIRFYTQQYDVIIRNLINSVLSQRQELTAKRFDVIICHDLYLLPLAFALKKEAKIIFDAREYYPRQYEDLFFWNIFFKKYNEELCKRYLRRCDKVITVSEGISQKYESEFGVRPDIVMSLPGYLNIQPQETDKNNIKMIYHGVVSKSRKIENMINLMDYLDKRFSLDLIPVCTDSRDSYYNRLLALARTKPNTNVIDPVSFEKIVPFTNKYDIGLYLLPYSNFNNKYALPNKFFEFIQARLMIAIGPSIEMARITKKYNCGIVAGDFDPQSIATELNKLTVEEIMSYKWRSHQVAAELNAEKNSQLIKDLVANLLM